MKPDAGDSKGSDGDGNSVKVYARVRPPGQATTNQTDLSLCLTVDTPNRAIILKAKPDPKVFTFDKVADVGATQESVFSAVAKNLIDSCHAGYNGTIFAYGQTGSGKTFTMMGPSEDETNPFHHELRGVIPRSFEYLFNLINQQKKLLGERIQYVCRASFLEIYNEQLSDLLVAGGSSLQLRENSKLGVIVEGITEPTINSASDAYKVLIDGWKNRRVAETAMNTESSRSHAVFTLHIESKENKDESWQIKGSRLNLVDLAGSERQKDTQTTGSRLKEGCSINKSLSALGNVIMCLVANSHASKPRYVPYRDSKLTFLLRDSLGGNAKTHIVACVHPGNKYFGETLSTLQFATRAKQIKNKAVVNEDLHGSIPALQAEIRRLKEDLAVKDKMLVEIKDSGTGLSSTEGVGSGPWRPRFIEVMRHYESMKLKLKQHAQKQQLVENQVGQKEKKIMQMNMVLRFRTETIKQLESKLKKNTDGDFDGVITSLRNEIRTLEEMKSSKHEVAVLTLERSALQNEVSMLQSQLQLHLSGEDKLVAAYEEAIADQDLKAQVYTPQNNSADEPVGTVERQKSQIGKLQAEIETVKRSHSTELEALKKKMADMESELVATQTAKESIAKTLKMTQERCAIEREQQGKMHLDTIKTITTPKTKYNLRSRLIMGSSSTSNSPVFNSSDVLAQTQAEDGFQEEQMPNAMYVEQIEGLTNEIETLQKGNEYLTNKIQEFEAQVISFTTEQSALQSKNKSLEQRLASYEEQVSGHDEKFSSVKKELHQTQESKQFAEEEVRDLRVMIAQMEKNLAEVTAKCDGLHQSNTSNESKVLSLTYQLEESGRLVDDLTLTLCNTQDELENRQTELGYLSSQQKELEMRLQQKADLQAETHKHLQAVQGELEKEVSTVEQLKSQMHQQGSEKEQELLTVLGQKEEIEKKLTESATSCHKLEQQIESLHEQLASQQEIINDLQRRKDEVKDVMNDVLGQRNELRQTLKDRESELEDVKTHLAETADRLEAEIAETVLHEKEFNELKEQHHASIMGLEEQLDQRDNKINQMEMQAELNQEDLDEVHMLNDELIMRNTALETESQNTKDEITKLNELHLKLSQENMQLKSKVAHAEKQLNIQQQESNQLASGEDVISKLKTELSELQEERNFLRQSHIETAQRLVDVRTVIFTLTHQINESDQKLAAQESEAMENLKKKEVEIQNWKQIAENEKQMHDQEMREKEKLGLILSHKAINIAQMKNDIAEKEKIIEDSKKKIELARNLSLKVTDQNHHIENLKQVLADKSDRLQRALNANATNQTEIIDLTSKLEEAKENILSLKKQRESLMKELEKTSMAAAELASHKNPNQKIHYVQQLKDENRQISEAKQRAEYRCLQLEKQLNAAMIKSGAKKIHPPSQS